MRLRKQAGLSQEDLAFEAELQRNYVSLMELGRYQPTITSLFKVAHALKMAPSALVLELENDLSAQAKKRK